MKIQVEITIYSLRHLELYPNLYIVFWNEIIIPCIVISYANSSSFYSVFLVLSRSLWNISKNWSSLKNNTKIKQKIVLAKHIGLIRLISIFEFRPLEIFSNVFIFIHDFKRSSLLFWNACFGGNLWKYVKEKFTAKWFK